LLATIRCWEAPYQDRASPGTSPKRGNLSLLVVASVWRTSLNSGPCSRFGVVASGTYIPSFKERRTDVLVQSYDRDLRKGGVPT